MDNMTCLVTGANSGLGFAMAMGLARNGATVVMLCRDPKRGRQARIALIAGSGNPNIDLMVGDLSSLTDVRRIADAVNTNYPRLDMVCNLAGISYPTFKTTREGNELNLATNLLGPFLLTELLIERLLDSAPATILNVSGEAHRTGRIYFEDIQLKKRFTLSAAAGQTAIGRVIWTYELARRLEGTSVTANTFCPGWTQTNIYRHYPWLFRLPFQLAAKVFASPANATMAPMVDFILHSALNGINGRYFSRGNATKSAPITYNRNLGMRLWEEMEYLTHTTNLVEGLIQDSGSIR